MSNLPVGFTHPLYLILLAALPAFYLIARRRRHVPRGPWPFSLVLRLLVALLVVLALAGLRAPAPAKSVATVFVVDLSNSVPADIREGAKSWVRQAMAKAGPDDLAGIVTMGSEPRIELPLGKERDHAEWGDPPPDDGTNIAAALELAADLLPPPNSGPLRRIVLLSDGNETLGDAQQALLRPQLRDVEVAVLSLPQRLNDTAITSLSVPPALREGEPAEFRVAITSPTSQQGTLRVWAKGGDDEHLLYEQTVSLTTGANEVPVAVGELPKGSWAIHAMLSVDGDSRPENNESWATTIVGDPARVLLVEGSPGEASAVAAALANARIGVDRLRPGQLPARVDQLLPYDSIVLANVPASALQRTQMEALQQFVGDRGHGLVVIGGDHTFGLGDYADTPLEQALPVTVQPPDRDQQASLALVLVIDRSGSMITSDTGDRRTSRIELAKEGAIQAVETLQDGDQVGVIAFDYNARWISEIRPIHGQADVKAISDRIATIQADGGTDIYTALDTAYKGLQNVQARVKHVILLTDGESPPAPFPALLNAMRRAGITVSTVGVGSDAGTQLLQDIARRGQGRYLFTQSARDLPRIMTQEARLAGRSFKQEYDFKPRLTTAAPAVRSLVPSDFPTLHGYVRVSAKPSAETVLTSDQGEPILAQWQYGLGRALVWTPDAQGPWSQDWVGTDQFQKLWPQAVRWTMPAPVTPGLQVDVRGDGRQATIRVESFEPTGQFRNLLRTGADVALPDGSAKHVNLAQTAPGHYEGRFTLAGPGPYFIQVTQQDDTGETVASQLTGYALPYLPEYQLTPANRSLMERLAAQTGGPRLNQPAEAWRRDTRHAWQPQEVWDDLLMAALVLFFADVAVRRLRLTLADVVLIHRPLVRLPLGLGRRMGQLRLPRLQLHPLQSGRR